MPAPPPARPRPAAAVDGCAMATLVCRVQLLDDTDPFNSTNFPEPTRPPLYTFREDIPLATQLAGVHRLLRAPQKVLGEGGRLGGGDGAKGQATGETSRKAAPWTAGRGSGSLNNFLKSSGEAPPGRGGGCPAALLCSQTPSRAPTASALGCSCSPFSSGGKKPTPNPTKPEPLVVYRILRARPSLATSEYLGDVEE